MTSTQVRQSFLDFFAGKKHAIVPSSSLLPDAPNLLFTNAGMNQFVPIFLGQTPCSYSPGRAADTQKCIRAGGKHNDLEEVGFDTYHQTFFEMLGNWSFGDYFKVEAIEWAWELVVDIWKFPPERLYASVYKPGPGEPASFDQEAYDVWARIFTKNGLDPKVHIRHGGKKDNFWMMGETGPCGPCSEIHIDLTPDGDTKGELVNAGSPKCIEIWNLVFIQFNAGPDGSFVPLPSRHVDTGMGLERVVSMMQGTRQFADFANAKISNYNTDIFRPIFDALEKLTGRTYGSTLPETGATELTAQEKTDVAFRVIADHLRTLSFAVADGISPSNESRGYVLRRILRRAVRYGRDLDLKEPFLHRLVHVLVETMGGIFPEIGERQARVEKVIRLEEESFFRTLERGLDLFQKAAAASKDGIFPGEEAFRLYDTYGFPLDLTQLMARERGLVVEEKAFEHLMEEQRARSQAAQKREIITVSAGQDDTVLGTRFVGYDLTETTANVLNVREQFLIVDETPFYAAMGGQVGDVGEVEVPGKKIRISDTQKSPEGVWLHRLAEPATIPEGTKAQLRVDKPSRARIEGHHSGTHLLHWALRTVLGKHVGQKGSYVGTDRLRFDFTQPEAMKPEEIAEVERLVREKIDENLPVQWDERLYAEVKGDPQILQFFGDKYGEKVRVVSIGSFSRELCGGTHVALSGRIGYFKILSEGAIAAGVRRIEAASGPALVDHVRNELGKQEERLAALKKRRPDLTNLVLPELAAAMSPLEAWRQFAARQETLLQAEAELREWEKRQAKEQGTAWQKQASEEAAALAGNAREKDGVPYLTSHIAGASAAYLAVLADALKTRWKGVALLAGDDGGKVSLLAFVSPEYTKRVQAGKVIQTTAPLVGGKGGGRPELAQGGGNQPENIPAALGRLPELW